MLTGHHCLGLLVGLRLKNVIFFAQGSNINYIFPDSLCFVYMDEEVNVGVGELWHAWGGAGAAGLPRGGQGEPAQAAEDRTGSVGMGMAKTGWDISPGSSLAGHSVAGLETTSHGWGRTG